VSLWCEADRKNELRLSDMIKLAKPNSVIRLTQYTPDPVEY